MNNEQYNYINSLVKDIAQKYDFDLMDLQGMGDNYILIGVLNYLISMINQVKSVCLG